MEMIVATYSDDIVALASLGKGMVTAKQVTAAHIPRYALTEMLNRGELSRIERGIYLLAGQWADEYKVYSLRYNKGVFSHDTALFLHGLTNITPGRFTMTFPAGYNTRSLDNALLEVRRSKAALFGIGLANDVITPSGNTVVCYDRERTLCDILRGSDADDTDRSKVAFMRYLRQGGRDVGRLLKYAHALHVTTRVQNYLKVLL